MAKDLKESGSAGSTERMKKMADKARKKQTVTEGTSEKGSKIVYRDKGKKSVRLEKDAEGKTYKTKTRKAGQKGSSTLTKNKKEISQKKYDRNKKRIEKVKSKGAITKTLRNSKEDKAQKNEAKYSKFKKAADEYTSSGKKIDGSRKSINQEYLKRYKSEKK
mgnify:CR=1 FL=1